MLAHFRLIISGRPSVRRTVVVDSLVEHLTVDFGHNYSRMAFSSSYPFVLGTSRSQGGFSGDPNLTFWEATVESSENSRNVVF